jgi:pantoate--beta-alanine ligase
MEIIRTIAEMKSRSAAARADGKTIGFVPTMGYLHEGHLSLARRSLACCDFTAVSIFVNPAQFGENEDLGSYPTDIESDRRKLEALGVQAVFLPDRAQMYPAGYKTYVNVEEITGKLCGKSRPAFFRGVTTVVLKLLNIVRPHLAFFGEKDRQQLAVVRKMVDDLNLDVTVVGMPIVREADGLAMSSRNVYLSAEERVSARCLGRALETARSLVQKGETSAEKILREMRAIVSGEPRTHIDYISVCDAETFVDLDEIADKALIALAVQVGKARLIDNCIVEKS